MRLDLASIRATVIDGLTKGYPGAASPRPLGDIGGAGWNVLRGDVPFPCAVLKASAIEANRRWMKAFLTASGASLAPHGKTTMSPQIFDMQLADGAWGITAATAEQLQVYIRFGVRRVVFANQLVGRENIAIVVGALNGDPGFDFCCLVDSVEGAQYLADMAASLGARRPIDVLVEIGSPLGRTGARSMEAAMAVARHARALAPALRLRGVETYEYAVKAANESERERGARSTLLQFAAAARAMDEAGLFAGLDEVLLSAGGTNYVDLAAAGLESLRLSRPVRPVLRSGCYFSHDHLEYARALAAIEARMGERAPQESLRPALEVWTAVQSRPEPDRAFATAGKRDLSYDVEMPAPIAWSRDGGPPTPLGGEHRVTALNDQHAYLSLPPDSPLKVGDLVGLGISHPCTTFDKWRLLYIVDDAYDVTDAVLTFF